jgi:hypothetical protein
LAFWGAAQFCHDRTKGFTLNSIDRSKHFEAQWETTPLDEKAEEKVAHILDQPFHFLGKGGQSYVFLSQDQKTVLKFFKKKNPVPDRWIELLHTALPKSLQLKREKHLQTRKERMSPIFSSCVLAYENLRKESGLLYLHLNPTMQKHKPLQVIDRLGITHTLDLNTATFLLQRRGELIFTRLKKLRKENDLEGAKRSIFAMMDFIVARCKAGIRDVDNGLHRNYGYLEEAPLSVDVGSFILDPSLKNPEVYYREVLRKTRKLKKWITRNYPELLPAYEAHLEELY